MKKSNSAFGLTKGVSLKFHTLRDFSTKNNIASHRRLWISQISTKELVKIDEDGNPLITDNSNVRGYLKTTSSGDKHANSGVHASIFDTLLNNADEFSLLNGGITIIAKGCEVNNDNKTITLSNPSIIYGTQTRGVLEVFHKEYPDHEIPVKVEILVLLPEKKENHELDVEITIARNHQTSVKSISKSGKRGHYEELDKVVEVALMKDESQKGKFDTLKLIQLLFLILPDSMWEKHLNRTVSRASIYSGKNKWNDLWADIHEKKDNEYKVLFDFFLQIANPVTMFYLAQKKSDLFDGCGRQIRSGSGSYSLNKNGSYNIKDGWLFPLISALSFYIVEREEDKKWVMVVPPKDSLKGILALIYTYGGYRDLENVQFLGKNKLAYETPLRFIENMDNESLSKEAKKTFR